MGIGEERFAEEEEDTAEEEESLRDNDEAGIEDDVAAIVVVEVEKVTVNGAVVVAEADEAVTGGEEKLGTVRVGRP